MAEKGKLLALCKRTFAANITFHALFYVLYQITVVETGDFLPLDHHASLPARKLGRNGTSFVQHILTDPKAELSDITSQISHMTSSGFTPSSSGIISSCEAFVDVYAKVAAEYSNCAVKNARPLDFCVRCAREYHNATSVYSVIMNDATIDATGHRCGDVVTRSDRVAIIERMKEFIDSIWDYCECSKCYQTINGSLTLKLQPNVVIFQKSLNKIIQCMQNNSQGFVSPFIPVNVTNSTVCANCTEMYRDLNDFYQKMENADQVCMDIIDSMNYTRLVWSRDFHCRKRRGDLMAVLLLSGFFSSLPVIFYIANKIHGVSTERKVMKQKRMRHVPPAPVPTSENDSSVTTNLTSAAE